MRRPRAPLFLERETYRRRRMMDAARILPVAGFVLILLPVLWTQGGSLRTAGEALYLFGLWLALVIAAALLSRPLRAALNRETAPPAAARTATKSEEKAPAAPDKAGPRP